MILEWDLVRVQVQEALQEFGCFEALFDKVPSELRKSIFYAVEELCNLPLQPKQKTSSQKLFQGYLGQLPMMPLYEGMAIDDANLLEKAESFTNLFWPEGNPGFWYVSKYYHQSEFLAIYLFSKNPIYCNEAQTRPIEVILAY